MTADVITLPLDLSKVSLNAAAQNAGDAVSDMNGVKVSADPNVSDDLSGTNFQGNGNLDAIASLAGSGGQAVTPGSTTSITMSTANYEHIYLAKGTVFSLDFGWITSDSSTENDYAFALFQREGGSVAATKLADQSMLNAAGITNGDATSAISYTINTSGYYDLLVGDVYNGSSAGSALRVKAITESYATSGTDAVTLSTAGLTTSDGSTVSGNGQITLADGSSIGSDLSGGGNALIGIASGLIGQDGAGLVGQDGAGIISSNSGGVISHDGGGLVAAGGGNIVAAGGGNVIAAGGGNVVSAGGGNFTPQTRAFSASSTSDPTGALIYAGVDANGNNTYVSTSTEPTTATYTQPAQTLTSPHQLGGTINVGSGPTANVAQGDASIASLSDGRFVVTWDDDKGSPGHFEIRAQIYNADGSPAGASFVVSTDTTHGSQEKPTVVGVAGGGFAIAWLGVTDSNHSQADIHLQMFSSTGAKVNGEARVGVTGVTELGPRLGSTWDGGFVLTYDQLDAQGNSAGVAVRYDSARTVKGIAIVGDHNGLNPASGVTVSDLVSIGLQDNSYIVAYREQNPNSSADHDGIFIDQIKADGTTGFSKVQVNTSTTGSQYTPSIARLNNNNIVVAWTDSGTSFTTNQAVVHAQVIDSSTGAKIGGELSLGTTLAGQSTGPSVVALDTGGFEVTWAGVSLNSGSVVSAHLESQIFSNDGSQESPVIVAGPISTSGTFFDKAPATTEVADSNGNHTVFIVDQHTGTDGTTSVQAGAFTTDNTYIAASQAPSGADTTDYFIRGFTSAGAATNKFSFRSRADFGFTDTDNNNFTGVTVTTLPATGKLLLNNVAVTAGQVISAGDMIQGKFVFEANDTATHTFTFQVHDDGSTAFGGQTIDPTPNTVTLKYDAPPVLSNVATIATYFGQAVAVSPNITITDVDDTMIHQGSVSFGPQGYISGDTLNLSGYSQSDLMNGVTIAGTNIEANLYASASSYSLNFSGDDTLAHYQQVLRSLTYTYTGSPTATGAAGNRTVFFSVGDPHGNFNVDYPYTTVASLNVSLVGTPPAHGVLGLGKSISLAVSVGSSVSVTGSPYLALSDGGKAVFNSALSNLATGKIVFTYTAGYGENTTNLAVSAICVPSGATIKSGGASLSTTTFTTPISTLLAVDTTPPLPPTSSDRAPVLATASDSGISQTDGITSAKILTFSGSAETGATVTLFDGPTTKVIGTGIANGTASNGLSTFTITTTVPLTDGAHTIFAKATDVAGNTSDFSFGRPITIDTVAPSTPAAPKLLAAFDSGSSQTDGITNTPNPAYYGTAEKGSTVSLYIDGQLVGTATASVVDGSYQVYSQTQFTQSATHQVHVTATDAAGNTSAPSANTTLVIDRTPPATPDAPVLTAASDTGGAQDGITSNTTPTVTGTAEKGSLVVLSDGLNVVGFAKASATTGAYSITSSKLTAGDHSLTVTATDVAGNVSGASNALAVTIDKPTLVLDPGSDSGVSSTDGITNVTTPTFDVSGVTGEVNASVTLYDGTKAVAIGAIAMDGTAVLTPSSALAQGSHSLTAKVTDATGHVSVASAAVTVVIDTTAPTKPAAPVLVSDTGASATDGITNSITGFKGTTEKNATVTLYINDSHGNPVPIGMATANASGAYVVPFGISLDDGTYSFWVKVTDVAGNQSILSDPKPVILDTTPPGAVSLSLDPGSDTGAQDGITKVSTPKVTGTADLGATVTLYDGAKVVGTAKASSADGSYTITASTLANGSHKLVAKVVDVAGNTTSSSPLPIFIETTPVVPSAPILAAGFDTGISSTDGITNKTSPTLSGTAAGGATVKLFDGTTQIATTTADVTGAYTFDLSAQGNTPLSQGSNILKAVAVDVFNNTTTSATRTVVVDTLGPTANIDSVSYTSAGKAPLTITGATLTKNDTDPTPGDALSLLSVDSTNSQYGLAAFKGGNAIYTPTDAVFTINTGGVGLLDTFGETIQDKAGNTSSTHVNINLIGQSVAANGTATMTSGADDVVLDLNKLSNVTAVSATGAVTGMATINGFNTAQDHLLTFNDMLLQFADPTTQYATAASLGAAANAAAHDINAAGDNAIFFTYADTATTTSTYLLIDHGTAGSFGVGDGLVKFAGVSTLPAADGSTWHKPQVAAG